MTQHVLSVAEMYRADSLAMASGIPGTVLMEAAGFAVAREVWMRVAPCRVTILCGPGNNGGDGFVVARLLARRGFVVTLGLLGEVENLKGDAAHMAALWDGPVLPLETGLLDRADLVVDALFGAGLARPLDGIARQVIDRLHRLRLPVVAVDVPSGVDGDSGAILGTAPDAVVTVTFFRKKPGHLLLPGSLKCGEVVVADIGIPTAVLNDVEPSVMENHPTLWVSHFPIPHPESHKYQRGHLLLTGGAMMCGAARLAARAARRIGAGLATIAAPSAALPLYAAGDAGNILAPLDEFVSLLDDSRRNVVLLGPGNGVGAHTRQHVLSALHSGKPCVLDADALTSFADRPRDLFRSVCDTTLLTPHDGEYERLFGQREGSRLDKARHAAAMSGAIILLKGCDTVIAHPDGRAVINRNAPPWLSTAGTGDVLAGMAAGLMAAGMNSFDAACAAAWLHGQCGQAQGMGLIAEDIADHLPAILQRDILPLRTV